MNIADTPSYTVFRTEVRAFLDEHWHPSLRRSNHEIERFRAKARDHGYLYRRFLRRHGGSEQPADPIKAEIIRDEFAQAGAPREFPGQGVAMVAPTLLEWGTEEQCDLFIPPTLRGEIEWAQGYSEPQAGSDLAEIRTRAELTGGEWRVNGHKIWTTRAFRCSNMFMLARTDPGSVGRDGLSYLLLDLRQPGVRIEPIRQIDGGREFCEVFFDDARAPAEWLVGTAGNGWDVSRSTLKHEGNMIGAASSSHALFERLVRLAGQAQVGGRPALEDSGIARRLVLLEEQVAAHLASSHYQLACAARGEEPLVEHLVNKLAQTYIAESVAQIAADVLGDRIFLPLEGTGASGSNDAFRELSDKKTAVGEKSSGERWHNQLFGSLALAIAGGTTNIHLNKLATRGLRLGSESPSS